MVSPTLLHPLQANSVEFCYCLDRPLKSIATQYTAHNLKPADLDNTACTLVFVGGISFLQDTWIPIIQELFRLSWSSRIKIRSAWVIERPNHGEPALINAEILKEHYSIQFPSFQYASAIHSFLTSDILSAAERTNLVGIGHSGGGGSLIHALEFGLRDGHEIPLKSLVLVEAPLIGPEVWPFFLVMYEGVRKSNARRTTSWPSKEAAMKWFATHFPWKSFSPDVLRIVEDTYFIPDSERPGFITTKTTIEQETACFVDNGTNLHSFPFLRTVLDILPTHVIAGSEHDMWPPEVYEQIEKNNRQVGTQLASVTVIDDVGHYLPVVKPREVATEVFRILSHKKDALVLSKL
ncbi:Alpha/beta hydrolase fold-1 [Mycena crocata]|nr:Alpha/beta hydrolase fold-1 [Mycena crocata]